jgi:DNA invertase Pin-like site-specific DNA recombinase
MTPPTIPPPLWVAYYRVSTDKQGRSGLGLEAQQAAVAAYLERTGGILFEAFTEVESGRKDNRPELGKALDLCRRKRLPLLIAKLDRLARSVALISSLMERPVEFRACDMPDASRFTLHILAAVAEHERDMASERTKAALQAAKARGVRLGAPNPEKALQQARMASVASADRFAEGVHPIIEVLREGGLNLSQTARELNERGIKTRTGKYWTAQAVKNIVLWGQRTD